MNAVFNQSVLDGVIPQQFPNFEMSWEKTATTNIGFVSHHMRQRLMFEAEYYIKNTTDMLIQPTQYRTLGVVTTPQVNAAAMKATGIDISAGWRDKAGDLRYSINMNVGYTVNEITDYRGKLRYELDDTVLDIHGYPSMRYTNLAEVSASIDNRRILEGHPHGEFFMRRVYTGTGTHTNSDGSVNPKGGPKDGMIRTRADLDWVRAMIAEGYSFNANTVGHSGGQLWYGELLYEDANDDGRLGHADDPVFLGKTQVPKWTFGLNLSAEWRGIDMSMHWSGRLGSYHYIHSRGINSSGLPSVGDALPADVLKMYYFYDPQAASANGGDNDYCPSRDPNANHTGLFPRILSSDGRHQASSYYLYNTSFLKLKSLQVGYSLPKQWLEPARISNMRVFISCENLLTIKHKDFRGVDPELGGSINVYPIPQMFAGGLSLTF